MELGFYDLKLVVAVKNTAHNTSALDGFSSLDQIHDLLVNLKLLFVNQEAPVLLTSVCKLIPIHDYVASHFGRQLKEAVQQQLKMLSELGKLEENMTANTMIFKEDWFREADLVAGSLLTMKSRERSLSEVYFLPITLVYPSSLNVKFPSHVQFVSEAGRLNHLDQILNKVDMPRALAAAATPGELAFSAVFGSDNPNDTITVVNQCRDTVKRSTD